MTVNEVLTKLEFLGNEKMRQHNKKFGAGDNQFGVKMGDIRALSQKIRTDHGLALGLWEMGNIEARSLATLIIVPKLLSAADLEKMVRSERFVQVADWLYNNVIKEHPEKEQLRQQWMYSDDVMCARLGWSLTSGRITRSPEGLDIPALLDRIESEMPTAAPEVQWTMNTALAQIGINMPAYRARTLDIGERLGVYRDYPVSKGCTSPFAPKWINEMVKRKSEV
jgi:3-methyladenine DNA glycosylase AlkD